LAYLRTKQCFWQLEDFENQPIVALLLLSATIVNHIEDLNDADVDTECGLFCIEKIETYE
jgi:hypothetical protein